MIKLIIFDLDDTLYDEVTFVDSGFKAVAGYLNRNFSLNKSEVFKVLKKHFARSGRGKIFDNTLADFNLKATKKLINQAVAVYRQHQPKIKTFPGIKFYLNKLRRQGIFLVLVTDTRWQVQQRKVKALGLESYFDLIIYTDKFGVNKSNHEIIKKVLRRFKISAPEAALVGDDPTVDFIGAKKLGCRTIRLRQGRLKNLTLDRKHEADLEVKSFKNLIKVLNGLLKNYEFKADKN